MDTLVSRVAHHNIDGGGMWSFCKTGISTACPPAHGGQSSLSYIYIYLLNFNAILPLLGARVHAIPGLAANRRGERAGKGWHLREGPGRKGVPDKITRRLPIGGEVTIRGVVKNYCAFENSAIVHGSS